MTITPPTIYIENAHLRYAQQTVFADLNVTLPAGQTTCLLGPSGVGKTSLLRLIAGFKERDPQTQLSAHIHNNVYQSLNGQIAYLAQTDLLFPWLTVLENVLAGFRIRGFNSSNKKLLYARAEKLLTDVGLADAKTKQPAQLSGGMRQRVALARTLMEERPVVLMDEPFSALDIITRFNLQELAANVLREHTVLLITHDPLEALRLGQQIFVLAGQPAKIIANYAIDPAPPRAITDPHLLKLQAEIINQLMQAQTANSI